MDSTVPQSETPQDIERYLEDTVLLDDERFDWLRPLLRGSLHEGLGPEDLENWVALQFGEFDPDDRDYRDLIARLGEEVETDEDPDQRQMVRRIRQLVSLSPGGGVTEIEDVELTDGLNILYAQDAEEQTRAWNALRGALGIMSDGAAGGSSGSGASECRLTIEVGEESEQRTVSYGGQDQDGLQVRVFGGSLSEFLLRRNEDGDFTVAPLEAQKIVRVRDNFTYLQELFEYRLEELEWDIADDVVFLEDQAGFSLEEEFEPTLDAVRSMEFSRSDERTLQDHVEELEALQEETDTREVDRLEETIDHLRDTLDELGNVREEGEGFTFEPFPVRALANRLREGHRVADHIDTLISGLDLDQLEDELPGAWLESGPWRELRDSADTVVRFLMGQVRDRLSPDRGGSGEAPPGLDDLDAVSPADMRERLDGWLEDEHEHLESILGALHSLVNPPPELAEQLEEQPFELADPAALEPALQEFRRFLTALKDGETDLDLGFASTISETLDGLRQTVAELTERRFELHDQQSRHLDRIQELKETVRDLKLRRAVVEHRDRILTYLTHRKELTQVRELVSDLSQARQALVDEDDRLAQELSSGPFQDRLAEEYEWLGFAPPDNWSVEPDEGPENEARYVRISRDEISEVLDPSQQQLQSLADFLARSSSSDDEAVYLFEDPLEDLDPDRRPRVILRLLRLARQGHQVVLLVHDRSFFNAVVDFSEEQRNEASDREHQLVVHPEVYSWKKKTLVKRWTQLETRIDPMQQKNSGSLARVGLSDEDIRSIHEIYESMTTYLEHFLEVFFMKNILNQFRPSVRVGTLDRLGEIAPEKITRIQKDHRNFLDNQSGRPEDEQQPKELLQDLLRDFKRMKEHYHYQQV